MDVPNQSLLNSTKPFHLLDIPRQQTIKSTKIYIYKTRLRLTWSHIHESTKQATTLLWKASITLYAKRPSHHVSLSPLLVGDRTIHLNLAVPVCLPQTQITCSICLHVLSQHHSHALFMISNTQEEQSRYLDCMYLDCRYAASHIWSIPTQR